MENTLKKLVSVGEAAHQLGIGPTSAKELVARGQLESVKIGARRLVPVDAISDFVERLRASGSAGALFDVGR
jgi:excisionase family DNA binding protein